MSEPVILTEAQKAMLNQLCDDYNQASAEATSFDNKKKALNGLIKQTMKDYGITKYCSSNGLNLNVSTRQNVTWDEEALTAYCKTLNKPDLIRTEEHVDFDVLETLLKKKEIDPTQLRPFMTEKPDIVTLKLTQKKVLNE